MKQNWLLYQYSYIVLHVISYSYIKKTIIFFFLHFLIIVIWHICIFDLYFTTKGDNVPFTYIYLITRPSIIIITCIFIMNEIIFSDSLLRKIRRDVQLYFWLSDWQSFHQKQEVYMQYVALHFIVIILMQTTWCKYRLTSILTMLPFTISALYLLME